VIDCQEATVMINALCKSLSAPDIKLYVHKHTHSIQHFQSSLRRTWTTRNICTN